MKSVVVLIHDDVGQESRLQAALAVTRALRGHLTCVGVAIMPSTAFDRDLGLEEDTEAANRGRLERRLASEDVSWDWVEAADYVDSALTGACDLADVIVVNSESATLRVRDVRNIAGTLALRSGKPILAVPAQASGIDAAGAALVAWDDSQPAAVALTRVVPLLRLARSVTIFQVSDDSERSLPERAAAYLSWHGIPAEIVREEPANNSVAELLLSRAGNGEYSYVVMGAYSKPRMLEALYGGVTRRMLRESPVPLFLGH